MKAFFFVIYFLIFSTGYAQTTPYASALPALTINTTEPVLTDFYTPVKANVSIKENGKSVDLGNAVIKGRGNSSWQFPKKPYALKFEKKVGFLDYPKGKDWVLLAMYSDKTLLRNEVASEISRQVNLSYTPRSLWVDVFWGAKYLGVYSLTEKIEVSQGRVDIDVMNEIDVQQSNAQAGYLLEIDNKPREDDFPFSSKNGVNFTVKDPKITSDAMLKLIKKSIDSMEDILFSTYFNDATKGYATVLDVESFINWYLVEELTKNNDAVFWTSVYVYKNRNGKLTMGPVWDHDISLGNCNYNDMSNPEGWWIRRTSWFKRLFEDPAFVLSLKKRWKALYPVLKNDLPKYIERQSKALENVQKNNFNVWPILGFYVWPNAQVFSTYDQEVTYLQRYYAQRLDWMNQQIETMP